VGGEGRISSMAIVNLPWSRVCVKARVRDDPDYPDQQKWKPKNEWKRVYLIYGIDYAMD